MTREADLSIEEARQLLEYDPETGVIRWRKDRRYGVVAGSVAGYVEASGYYRIGLRRRNYAAHRVAWLLTHGVWPSGQIDHIDGDRANNRLSNLRQATHGENCQNAKRRADNVSGVKGVIPHRLTGKWAAQIRANGRRYHLGLFDTVEEAAAARQKASVELHGEFAREGT